MKTPSDFKNSDEYLEYFEQLIGDGATTEELMESADGIDEEWLLKNVGRDNGREGTNEEFLYVGRARGFLVLRDEILYSGNHLTHGERWTWVAIFLHDWRPEGQRWRAFPSRERLGIIVGVGKRQVSTYLKGLEEKGLLLRMLRPNQTTRYILKDPPKEWMEETKRKIAEQKAEKHKKKLQTLEDEKERFFKLSQARLQDTAT
jgi:hypothetical protein